MKILYTIENATQDGATMYLQSKPEIDIRGGPMISTLHFEPNEKRVDKIYVDSKNYVSFSIIVCSRGQRARICAWPDNHTTV
jgi:uncharacterized protein YbcV (DUF1398 family)